jgi:hypothetical protein
VLSDLTEKAQLARALVRSTGDKAVVSGPGSRGFGRAKLQAGRIRVGARPGRAGYRAGAGVLGRAWQAWAKLTGLWAREVFLG